MKTLLLFAVLGASPLLVFAATAFDVEPQEDRRVAMQEFSDLPLYHDELTSFVDTYSELRDARYRVYDALAKYADAGQSQAFIRADGTIRQVFIDAQGQPCAMAFVLQQTGHASLAENIRAHDNSFSFVTAADQASQDWILRSGLLQEECASIQEPAMEIDDEPEWPRQDRRPQLKFAPVAEPTAAISAETLAPMPADVLRKHIYNCLNRMYLDEHASLVRAMQRLQDKFSYIAARRVQFVAVDANSGLMPVLHNDTRETMVLRPLVREGYDWVLSEARELAPGQTVSLASLDGAVLEVQQQTLSTLPGITR